MMRWLLRLVLLLMVGLPLVLVALLFMALDQAPLVTKKVVFTPAHIERAKLLLARNDPRKMKQGALRTILVAQEDVDLSANYLADRYAHGAAQVVLRDGATVVRASFALPDNPVGRYVNVDATLTDTGGLPEFAQLRVGSVAVPALLGNWLLDRGLAHLQADANYASAADFIKQVSATEGLLKVTFEWKDAAMAQLKAIVVSPEDQARWQAYQARLGQLTQSGRGPMALDRLLVPLLQLAAQRTATGGGSAAAENRALMVVLTFYVNGEGLGALVPVARDWPRPAQRVVTLAGRTDSPQHFMVSAALAATAGSPLTDTVGLYKELDDSRNSSGFSFNDLAADRAGSRLGELAAASDASAKRLHRALLRGLREPDFVPDIADMPEFISEAEFKRQYGGVGQPAYQKMAAEIERRVAALSLYR